MLELPKVVPGVPVVPVAVPVAVPVVPVAVPVVPVAVSVVPVVPVVLEPVARRPSRPRFNHAVNRRKSSSSLMTIGVYMLELPKVV